MTALRRDMRGGAITNGVRGGPIDAVELAWIEERLGERFTMADVGHQTGRDTEEIHAARRRKLAAAESEQARALRCLVICAALLEGQSIRDTARLALAPRRYVVVVGRAMPEFAGWPAP